MLRPNDPPEYRKALNLTGMKVHRHHAGHTSRDHQIRDQLGGNRLASASLAILTGIGIIWHNSRDAVCRSALAGIRHNQQFHEVVIHRIRSRLNDENILAADTLADHDLRFPVVEMTDVCITEIYTDVIGDFLCQLRIRITGQDA